jgi:hypothetical protein
VGPSKPTVENPSWWAPVVRKITIVGVSLTQPKGFYEVGGGEGNVQKLVSDAVQTNLDNREVAGRNEIFPDQQ